MLLKDTINDLIIGLIETFKNINYKVGDKVRIKSLEWYKNNCDLYGNIVFPREDEEDIAFDPLHAEYCGQIMTISSIVYDSRYIMEDDIHESEWTDEMIEGLVEDTTIKIKDLRKFINQMEIEGLNDDTVLVLETKRSSEYIEKITSMEYSPTTNILIFG